MAGESSRLDEEARSEGLVDGIIGGKAEGWNLERFLSLLDGSLRQEAAQLCARLLRPLLRRAYDAGRQAAQAEQAGSGPLLLVSAHCRGRGAIALCEDGRVVAEREGRIPPFLSQEGGDGHIELAIDLATGRLANWRPLDEEELAALFDRTK
jgi:hypothetical protein